MITQRKEKNVPAASIVSRETFYKNVPAASIVPRETFYKNMPYKNMPEKIGHIKKVLQAINHD